MAKKRVDPDEELIKEAMEYAEKHEPSPEEIEFRKNGKNEQNMFANRVGN